jgi:hypothetical protein
MNRAQEWSFVWALADSAADYLQPNVRVRLCAKIGAGEYERAIADLLVFYADRRAALPYEFAAPIRAWIRGYAGTDREPVLLRLYDRIVVSVMTHRTAQEPALDRNRFEHVGLRPRVGRDRSARQAR